MIKYLLSFLYLINIANAFSVSFPGLVKNKAIIKNINVKKLSESDKKELKLLFDIVPFMVFKNQKVSPFEYHDFVKIFDDKYNLNAKIKGILFIIIFFFKWAILIFKPD